MIAGELLGIDPLELKFPFELDKQISCFLQLSNRTEDCVAFKVKTTSPKKYTVRPNMGIVLPRSTCDVIVTMQAQREAPRDMKCEDKFLVQGFLTSASANLKDIAPEMFTKESGKKVDEVKLRVVYVAPPRPPSLVPKESEEGLLPKASKSENRNLTTILSESTENLKPQERSEEATVLISKLREEKNFAIQQNNKIRQELELVRREVSKQHGGFSLMFVIVVVLLGILLGYLVKA
ncbi:vesicle-associated protein 1-2-like [Typha latifolia]|uniref:vesicle-associated protein 1-2-like n=1 Tax=Typha latifolia TaxID=4733 RepID=UPI003C2DA480